MRFKFFILILFSNTFLIAQAQKEMPKGFSKGHIILQDNLTVPGYIKENFHNASILIITEAGKKKNYDGNELLAVDIDSARFLCIKGDFFKLICDGELCFLQKVSDASAKPVYNGTEALFINGTEGKVNDYFFYDRKQQQLKLLTKKNMAEVVDGTFNNCTAAISKAKETGNDPAQLRQAVEIYNNRTIK